MFTLQYGKERNRKSLLKMGVIFTSLFLFTACVPPGKTENGGEDCKPAGNSQQHNGKDDSDRDGHGKDEVPKCNNTSTETSTNTNTSTSTDTHTGPYPFPTLPGRVCTIDRFQQTGGGEQTLKKVDILFMMDHSGSMKDDWERVAGNIRELVKELPADTDIRYSVILGDVTGWKGKLYAPARIPVVLDNQKMSVQEISQNLQKIFVEGMKINDSGSGEALFQSLYFAVTANARENQKAGFFRPDAALSVIFMSDEQEIGFPFPSRSALAAQGLPYRCDESFEENVKSEYYDKKGINLDVTYAAVKALKGDMPVKTHAFVNLTKEDLFKRNSKNAKCLYDSLGYGYKEMVGKTKGVLFSIQEEKAKGLAACGKAIKESLELVHDFKLSKPADKVDPATIIAAVDGAIAVKTYSSSTNSVHIDDAGVFNSNIEIHHCEPVQDNPIVWTISSLTGSAGQFAANVQWTTPELATAGRVLWGNSANALTNELNSSAVTTNHAVTISDLSPNTVYYFQAVSWDGDGKIKQSNVLSLRTQPDWAISGYAGQASRNSAVVKWKTEAYATKGHVLYGSAPDALGNQSADTVVANEHSVQVDGLNANSTYYFQAVSSDEFGLEKRAEVIAVQTLTDWAIVNLATVAARTSVDITWSTPELATLGKVVYGTSSGALTSQVVETASANDHGVSVTGLNPNTIYYFQAVGVDSLGVEKRSEVVAVRTLIDWNISGFMGQSTETSVSLSWATLDYNTSGKVLWGLSETALNGVVVDAATGIDHAATVSGLAADTLYYFQAVASDDRGIEKRSQVVAIRTQPKAPTPDPLPSWSITNFGGTATIDSVTLTWNTDQYGTNGKILWGESLGALSNQVAEVGTLNNHTITVSGLTANTLYYFQAVSSDDKGQVKSSDVITVSTLQSGGGENPPPVGNWQILGFDGTTTVNSATMIWQTPGASTKAVLKVGLAADNLTLQTISIDSFAEAQLTSVGGLNPNTTYFFQVIATDQNGRTVESVVISKRTKAQ